MQQMNAKKMEEIRSKFSPVAAHLAAQGTSIPLKSVKGHGFDSRHLHHFLNLPLVTSLYFIL